MTLPKSIKIGPFTYKVEVRDEVTDLGTAHLDHEKIVLSAGQPPTSERETLLHEVMHACGHLSGLRNRLGNDEEEDAVRSICTALFDTLRRNKALRTYLFDDR